MSKFYPAKGCVAIQRYVNAEKTYAGIIYKEKEAVFFVKGKVLSVGIPDNLPSGAMRPVDILEGDWVLYRRAAVNQITLGDSTVDIVKYTDIDMVIDEKMKVSL